MSFSIEKILITLSEGTLFFGTLLVIFGPFLKKGISNVSHLQFLSFYKSFELFKIQLPNQLIIVAMIYASGIFIEYTNWLVYKPLIIEARLSSVQNFQESQISYLEKNFEDIISYKGGIEIFYKAKNAVYYHNNYYNELMNREQRINLMLSLLSFIAILFFAFCLSGLNKLFKISPNLNGVYSISWKSILIGSLILIIMAILTFVSMKSELNNYNMRIIGYALELTRNK